MIVALMLANFIAAAGITIIAPILGIAGQLFRVEQSLAMWLMTGFMLAYASLMPIAGRLSDNLGSKRVFLASISVFALGSVVSAISTSFAVIIGGRVLQGLGAAGVLPIANAIVSKEYPNERGKYLALVNATYGLGMVAGINLGGITFDAFGWRSMFILTAIVSGLAVVLAFAFIKEGRTEAPRARVGIDVPGSLFFATAVVSFMLLFRTIGSDARSASTLVVFSVLLVAALVALVVRERAVSNPAIDLSAFRRPTYLTYNLVALAFGVGMFVVTTMLPTFAQALLGFSVSQSVYAVDPFAGGMLVFVMVSAPLIRRFGPRAVLLGGGVVFAAGALALALFTTDERSFFINTVLISAGLGLCMTPMNYIVIDAGGSRNEGASAGMVSVMRSLGGVVGPTIAGLLMSRVDYSSLFVMNNILGAYSSVFMLSFYAIVALVILSAIGIFLRSQTTTEVSQ